MDVRKLQIFDRYGSKVYGQIIRINGKVGPMWSELPSATYYIMLANSKSKTGWIYLIEK
jgi:hypothetical protein